MLKIDRNLVKTFFKLGFIFFMIIILIFIVFGRLRISNSKSNELAKLYCYVTKNRLEISFKGELETDQLEIIFEDDGAIFESRDKDQFNRLQKKYNYQPIRIPIYKSGLEVNEIPFVYGKQRLLVYYNKNLIGECGQFKFHANHVHDYRLEIKLVDEEVKLEAEIIGPGF